jgi:hypothetical protein
MSKTPAYHFRLSDEIIAEIDRIAAAKGGISRTDVIREAVTLLAMHVPAFPPTPQPPRKKNPKRRN